MNYLQHTQDQASNLFTRLIPCLLLPLFLLGWSTYLSAHEITTIRVAKKAEIDEDNILLGKIATINGKDVSLTKRLGSIVIGKAPLAGQSRRINEDYINIRLKQNRIDLSLIDLQGPKIIEVFRGSIEIPKKSIQRLVLDCIYQKIPWEKKRVKVKNIRVDRDVTLPKGKITFSIIPPRNTNYVGTIPFSVVFNVNGRFSKKVWATATIEVLTEVVITKRPIKRYQLITENDICLKKENLTRLPSSIITNIEEVLGKRTKRKINANEILRPDFIELPPLVKRGDVVSIVAESDFLRITALGEVKGKGRKGDRVRVMNLDSKKNIYAHVLDSNTVKVDSW